MEVPYKNLSQLLHTINFWQGEVVLLEPGVKVFCTLVLQQENDNGAKGIIITS